MNKYDLMQLLKDSEIEEKLISKARGNDRPYTKDVIFNFINKLNIVINEIAEKLDGKEMPSPSKEDYLGIVRKGGCDKK